MPLLRAFAGCLGNDRHLAASPLKSLHKSTLPGADSACAGFFWQKLADSRNEEPSSQPELDAIPAQYNSPQFQSNKDHELQRSLTFSSASSTFAITTAVSPASASSDETTRRLSDASTDSSVADAIVAVPRKEPTNSGLLSKLQQTLKQQQRLKQLGTDQLLGVHVLADGSATSTPLEELSIKPTSHAAVLPSYVLRHGRGIMALSTLQKGMQHFVMPGIGYVAYSMMYNGPPFLNIKSAVALGDPICAPENFSSIAAAFLKQHPKAMFVQVSREFAQVLQDLGLLVNSMGGETELDLQKYTFSGYAKRGLRSAITSAVKEGVTVEEVMHTQPAPAKAAAGPRDWSQLAAEMQEVDREWVKAKGKHAGRIWFLNRSPVFAPEPGVRKLIARSRDGRLQAFIFFDAVYEAGSEIGYYANVTRMRPDAHPGVLNLLIKEFIDRIRSEAQLSAPRKNLSIKRSQRKKQQLQQQQQQQPDTANTPDAAARSVEVSVSTSAGINSASRFLSLGLSLLHQMDDSHFKHNSKTREYLELARKHGSAFYPFKSLAAAKGKYGAGLHDGRYEDPNVTYKQVYLAHTQRGSGAASFVSLFDLGILIGVYKGPHEAIAGLLTYKAKRRFKKMVGKRPSAQAQH